MTFRARLYKRGLQRCVAVPKKVSAALGGGTHIAIRGWIEDLEIRSTLSPRGRGLHLLVVNSKIWKPLKLDAGDTLTISLWRDQAPAQFPVPPEFVDALAEDAHARTAYEQRTPAFRRQIANYVAGVKSPAAREKRIAAMLERLRSGNFHGPMN